MPSLKLYVTSLLAVLLCGQALVAQAQLPDFTELLRVIA